MAGSIIVTRTVSGVPEQRAALYNSWIARPHGIAPFTWSKLRIGIRCTAEGNGGVTIPPFPRFFMGLCSGTANPVGARIVDGAVGIISDTGSGWTFNAAGAGVRAYYSFSFRGCSFINSATFNNGTTQSGAFSADASAATRRLLILDITRTNSTTMKVDALVSYTNPATPDVTPSDLFQTMELVTPAFLNHAYFPYGSVPYNESANGALDCVNFSWDKTIPGIHICDVAVVRVS